MKIVCDRAALVEALGLARGVVAARTPTVALTCVRIVAGSDGLRLSATDGEAGLELVLGSVEVVDPGEVLIPADKLDQCVRSLDGDDTVTLQSEGPHLHVRGAASHFKFLGQESSGFPGTKAFPTGAPTLRMQAGALRRMISRTLFATAVENSRYAISGVLLERKAKRIQMVATDGRRLAMTRSECAGEDGEFSAIVPGKTLGVLNRLLSDPEAAVEIARQGSLIWFRVGDGAEQSCLSSSLVEGVFPPFEDVIPKEHDRRVTFDTAEFSSAVRRAALLTNEENRGVRMNFSPSRLTLSSRAPEMGESEISVELEKYEGEPLEIGFNPTQLTDALKVIDGPEVIMEFKSPTKPGVLRLGSEFTYVVMPVSLA